MRSGSRVAKAKIEAALLFRNSPTAQVRRLESGVRFDEVRESRSHLPEGIDAAPEHHGLGEGALIWPRGRARLYGISLTFGLLKFSCVELQVRGATDIPDRLSGRQPAQNERRIRHGNLVE